MRRRVFRVARIFTLMLLGTSCAVQAQSVPPDLGWHELANTALRTVCPANGFGGSPYGFRDKCPGVIAAWNSAVFDKARNRLIIWGGGHTDYSGNELYTLELNPLRIRRLTDPAVPVAESGCPEALASGTQPNSRHTYDAITYVEHADSMFVLGGALAESGCFGNTTWIYNFANSTWARRNPRGPIPTHTPGLIAVYDPISRKIFVHDRTTLYSYDVETDKYTDLAKGEDIDYHMTGVVDPVRRKLVLVGTGNVHVYDLSSRFGLGRRTIKTTGGAAIVNSGYPGLAYDPVTDRIVAWNGGDSVYSLNLEKAEWTSVTYPGGPGKPQESGTFKRWSYSPAAQLFILVNSMDSNAYAFRLYPPR